jgi:hypothetical protein
MMRGDDPQDLADVEFMIRHDRVPLAEVQGALAQVVIPDLVELRDAFDRAKPLVLELARQIATAQAAPRSAP